jgi:hypothetical protein
MALAWQNPFGCGNQNPVAIDVPVQTARTEEGPGDGRRRRGKGGSARIGKGTEAVGLRKGAFGASRTSFAPASAGYQADVLTTLRHQLRCGSGRAGAPNWRLPGPR